MFLDTEVTSAHRHSIPRPEDPQHSDPLPQGLTRSLDRLFGGGVLPFVLNGRGIGHPCGGAVLTEMVFQPLDGAVELDRADLEVNSHEI